MLPVGPHGVVVPLHPGVHPAQTLISVFIVGVDFDLLLVCSDGLVPVSQRGISAAQVVPRPLVVGVFQGCLEQQVARQNPILVLIEEIGGCRVQLISGHLVRLRAQVRRAHVEGCQKTSIISHRLLQ